MRAKEKIHTGTDSFKTIAEYLPEGALPLLKPLVSGFSLVVKIKASRKSKFGDYRPLLNSDKKHQITINNDLNPYAFLVTLLHELAHMYTFERYKGKVMPHGHQWKKHYSLLLYHFIQAQIFPKDLEESLINHLHGPTASSCSDHTLYLALKKYDETQNLLELLENLKPGEHFKWRNGLIYRKEEKLRKRYRCVEVRSQRVWLFHPMAEVERLEF